MKGKKHPEYTHSTIEALYQKLKSQRENKRMRATAYRLRKKQREIDREYKLQTLKKQNISLQDEVKRLRKEMEQMSADLTNYITHYQQLSAQTFHQVYHRYPENNETWNTTRWDVNNEQLAIEGPPSTEALLRMQEDNQSDNDDDDLINNQGMNSGEITMQDEELANYMKNVL